MGYWLWKWVFFSVQQWPTVIRDSIDNRQRYVTRSMTDSDTWLDRWPTAIRDSIDDRQRYVTRSCSNFLTAADQEAAVRDGRAAWHVSLAGASTNIIFCRDKNMLFATKLLSRQNHVCRDKYFSRQAFFCRDKHTIVNKNKQKQQQTNKQKTFVATEMILVAATASDTPGRCFFLFLFLLHPIYYLLLASWNCSSAVHFFSSPTVCAHRP